MGKQLIISVGREFGSGGHEIAEMLAKKFDLKLYDKNLLQNIAQEKEVDAQNIEKYVIFKDSKGLLQLYGRERGTDAV